MLVKAHAVTIATKPRNARAPKRIDSRFECSCGVVGAYTSPERAHVLGDEHVAAQRIAGELGAAATRGLMNPPARSRKTLPRTARRHEVDAVTDAIAQRLGLALPPPRRRGFVSAETCSECDRRGYHLAGCSRRPR